MRTARLTAAAVVIGGGVALHVVSSAQTARGVKGPELARALQPQKKESPMYFKAVDVAGVRLFYREAGDPSKPAIVLLHGFPSSSHHFHDLIPRLADRFHVLAPDYPGMGYSDAPAPAVLQPNFDDVGKVIDAFIARLAPGPLILYMHDIGGQIGMRIAAAHPERIAGLVFQNFTLTEKGWNPERLKVYERLGGPETPEKLAETAQLATVQRAMFLNGPATEALNVYEVREVDGRIQIRA